MRMEELGNFEEKKISRLVGNRTLCLPACSIVPQPLCVVYINHNSKMSHSITVG
jgi:hypothetical protein